MEGEFPTDDIQNDRIERLLTWFETVNGLLHYDEKVCVRRRCLGDVW